MELMDNCSSVRLTNYYLPCHEMVQPRAKVNMRYKSPVRNLLLLYVHIVNRHITLSHHFSYLWTYSSRKTQNEHLRLSGSALPTSTIEKRETNYIFNTCKKKKSQELNNGTLANHENKETKGIKSHISFVRLSIKSSTRNA